jgi:hypothetical protein
MPAKPKMGTDELFPALERTDRSCRLILKQLRESHPEILEEPEFEGPVKLARRQLRENRTMLGTEPADT